MRYSNRFFLFALIPFCFFAMSNSLFSDNLFIFNSYKYSSPTKNVDVLVVGGGASGITAAIQSARLNTSTLLIEETKWLGGMLTSAGVSAVDGNYNLNSGLWQEFKNKLSEHYGGLDNLKTGWVSNVLFEPNIGENILSEMAKNESFLEVWRESSLRKISREDEYWIVEVETNKRTQEIRAKVVIDATELGDLLKLVGIEYSIGMDSRYLTNESIAPVNENEIIQDLTYVMILKDYGENNKIIDKPKNYDPSSFNCACDKFCDSPPENITVWPCDKMLDYGKLPNNYYMINWPIFGNDYYTNTLELSPKERNEEYKKAKLFSLSFLYFIQSELGYKNLGLADDIFMTEDNFPLIPYHRESRRMKGIVQLDINDLTHPFDQEEMLYRTGIAVGDYPVDHHHRAYPLHNELPDLHFYPIPSYSVPLGSLIPSNLDNFIVSEKSISVTNIVNGTTRLQPVCMLHGQASGVLAALSSKKNITPAKVSIREVQSVLLENESYIMPYSDVFPNEDDFVAIQKIGSTGILRGEGKNIGWKNHTFFYPDSLIVNSEITKHLREWGVDVDFDSEFLKVSQMLQIINEFKKLSKFEEDLTYQEFYKISLDKGIQISPNSLLKRREFSVILNEIIDPFNLKDVDHRGVFK